MSDDIYDAGYRKDLEPDNVKPEKVEKPVVKKPRKNRHLRAFSAGFRTDASL